MLQECCKKNHQMAEIQIDKYLLNKSFATNLSLQWLQWAFKKLICEIKLICFLYPYFKLGTYSLLKWNFYVGMDKLVQENDKADRKVIDSKDRPVQ